MNSIETVTVAPARVFKALSSDDLRRCAPSVFAEHARPGVSARYTFVSTAQVVALLGAEGWQPVFFYPEKADQAWGDALRAGMAKRDPELGPLDIMVSATLAIGDDVEDRLAWAKPQLALYIGGMGARGKNFYHNLATRYGFGDVADHIQDLYLSGRKAEVTISGAM